MLKIAITVGPGSGKSVVARMFQELGAAVTDADVRKARRSRIEFSSSNQASLTEATVFITLG